MPDWVIPVVLFVGVIVSISWISIWIESKRSKCKKCKIKYDYARDIAWEVVEQIDEPKARYLKVEVTCRCANCGEEQMFNKKFQVARYIESGNRGRWEQKNIESLIKEYFKNAI